MTKQEKEIAIIEGMKKIPVANQYGYRWYSDLDYVICKVMGYRCERHSNCVHMLDRDTMGKVCEIIHRMQAKGIIKSSKAGNMFKVI